MAWNTVPTFVAGNVLTAAQMNDLGGNLTSLRGDFAQIRRSTGSYTINGTTWADVDTGLDLVLAASSGDVVEFSLSGLAGSEATDLFLDVVTWVSGAPVTSFATLGAVGAASQGVLAWRGVGSALENLGGNAFVELAAGDISSSTVTLRLRARTNTAVNKTLFGSADVSLLIAARNHGPVQI